MELLTISQYAKKCGVSRIQIHNRINAGKIKTVQRRFYLGLLIDVDKYPPIKKQKAGRKKNK